MITKKDIEYRYKESCWQKELTMKILQRIKEYFENGEITFNDNIENDILSYLNFQEEHVIRIGLLTVLYLLTNNIILFFLDIYC